MLEPWLTRGRLAAWTLLSAACLAGCAAEQERITLPATRGYLLISIDTLRADHLGCYGYGRPTSPFLDRLAAGGVVFEDAIAQAPWTAPSHAAMLASSYPTALALGNFHNPRPIPEDAAMLACAICGELALTEDGNRLMTERDGQLICLATGETRPVVCAACGATKLKRIRLGVSRAAEELSALLGEPVAELTADGLPRGSVFIFPAVGHGVLDSHVCAAELVRAFLARPDAPRPPKCLAKL